MSKANLICDWEVVTVLGATENAYDASGDCAGGAAGCFRPTTGRRGRLMIVSPNATSYHIYPGQAVISGHAGAHLDIDIFRAFIALQRGAVAVDAGNYRRSL